MKQVLFDENMPRQLRRDLPGVAIRTVQEEGWSGLTNGQLLRRAQERFEVLVTADRRLQHQQNIPEFQIAVVLVVAPTTRLLHLRPLAPQIMEAIASARPGKVVVVAAT